MIRRERRDTQVVNEDVLIVEHRLFFNEVFKAVYEKKK